MKSAGTVIVTGASGFIGKATAYALRCRGGNVIGTHRPNVPVSELPDGRDIVADLSLTDAWDQLYKFNPEAVIHIAAKVPLSFDKDVAQSAAVENRAIDRQVIAFCEQSGARLVYASSTSVFRITGDYYNNAYALQKAETEQLVESARINSKCCLRINSPYGPGQTLRTVMNLFVRSALRNEPLYYFGTGGRTQDFIHVNDVANAFVAAYDSHANGVFTVASGTSISMKALAYLIVDSIAGCTSTVLPAGNIDSDEDYRSDYDISATIECLDWKPYYTLQEGIVSLITSMQKAQ